MQRTLEAGGSCTGEHGIGVRQPTLPHRATRITSSGQAVSPGAPSVPVLAYLWLVGIGLRLAQSVAQWSSGRLRLAPEAWPQAD